MMCHKCIFLFFIAVEELDVDSVKYLNEGDLEPFGFGMGHRKKILAWIASQSTQEGESTSGLHVHQSSVSTPSTSIVSTPTSSAVERMDVDGLST